MSAPALSVVLPVYNEAQVLERNLDELVRYLASLAALAGDAGGPGRGGGFEVVAVDDGSTDGSLGILERMAEREPRIRVRRLPQNRGKGAAVREGVLAAEGARVLFLDADLSTPLEEIAGFVGALDSGYDVAIGDRRAPGARITRHQPWLRETLGKGFTLLARLLLARGVHDFTCGLKGYRRDAARAIFERSTLDGWAFDAELVVIAQELGLRVAQLPVVWHDEEDTKVRLGRAVSRSLVDLATIWWRRLRGRYGRRDR